MEVNEEYELEVDSDVDDESDEEEVELFVDEEAEANHEAESMQWKAIRFRPKVITDNEKTLWNKVKGRVHAVVRKIAVELAMCFYNKSPTEYFKRPALYPLLPPDGIGTLSVKEYHAILNLLGRERKWTNPETLRWKNPQLRYALEMVQ